MQVATDDLSAWINRLRAIDEAVEEGQHLVAELFETDSAVSLRNALTVAILVGLAREYGELVRRMGAAR